MCQRWNALLARPSDAWRDLELQLSLRLDRHPSDRSTSFFAFCCRTRGAQVCRRNPHLAEELDPVINCSALAPVPVLAGKTDMQSSLPDLIGFPQCCSAASFPSIVADPTQATHLQRTELSFDFQMPTPGDATH